MLLGLDVLGALGVPVLLRGDDGGDDMGVPWANYCQCAGVVMACRMAYILYAECDDARTLNSEI